MLYRVRFVVIPAGVGPDDYEPGDFPERQAEVELADPELGGVVDGGPLVYGPPIPEVKAALAAAEQLAEGEEPVILDIARA